MWQFDNDIEDDKESGAINVHYSPEGNKGSVAIIEYNIDDGDFDLWSNGELSWAQLEEGFKLAEGRATKIKNGFGDDCGCC